ncbi:hypothetical protein FAZ95_13820 [Trinickia violacea]|uniref:Uncharacterized protein n=1 Tax=Trinickia violacea TaxID=2571746 RepID=A0A4P8IPU9_9BURK|nr:hypothetical protein [Trinickia violacea]QCP50161.1 hypothetical protein FAZ95_13820 [Trinickia violacea]
MATDWLPAGYVGGFAGHYVEAVKAQLAEFGEWVKHRPSGGKDDWVFMHFVEPPDDLHLGGAVLEVAEVNPKLRGLIADFAVVPVKYKQYAEGHTRNGTGSLMVVRGILYEVKDVKLNPWGEVRLPLLEISGPGDPNFYTDLSTFLCSGSA